MYINIYFMDVALIVTNILAHALSLKIGSPKCTQKELKDLSSRVQFHEASLSCFFLEICALNSGNLIR